MTTQQILTSKWWMKNFRLNSLKKVTEFLSHCAIRNLSQINNWNIFHIVVRKLVVYAKCIKKLFGVPGRPLIFNCRIPTEKVSTTIFNLLWKWADFKLRKHIAFWKNLAIYTCCICHSGYSGSISKYPSWSRFENSVW